VKSNLRLTAVNIQYFGWIACAYTRFGLLQSTLFHDSETQAMTLLRNTVGSFWKGDATDLVPDRDRFWQNTFMEFFMKSKLAQQPESIPLDDQLWTGFQKTIYQTLRRTVLWGETITYGELATRSGCSGAARAVGTAMARNRCAPFVPCHRVIQAGGGIGRYSGIGGADLKARLLRFEAEGDTAAQATLSRRPSPRKFRPSTTIMMASPGKTVM
jgi:O-6-methylguanine DNA methyltransferase